MAYLDLSASNPLVASEDERQKLRRACKDSLYFLCKAVLGFKDFTVELHKPACDMVQDQSFKRKKLMLPRSTFKSHICTIGYPVWLTIQDKDPDKGLYGSEERILIANAVADNSRHFVGMIKSVYERNVIFQWLFPELIPDFKAESTRWNQDEATISRPAEYPEPTFSAVGVGTSVVSRHFTHIILDDLINESHAASPILMQKAIEWYGLIEPLLVTLQNEIILVGTRWAMNDLYSHVEKTEGEYTEENPKGYKSYMRAAIEDGKAIFPQRLPIHDLLRFKRTRGAYLFSCLYMNNPSNPDVNSFDPATLRYYQLNAKNWICIDPPHGTGLAIDPTPMQRAVIIDIAAGTTMLADQTGITCVGCDDKRRLFILEAWKGRVKPSEFIKRAVRYAIKWHVDAIYFENYGQQRLVEEPLKDAVAKSGYYFQVLPIRGSATRGAVDKQIEFFTRYCEAGMVYCRETMTDFIQEVREFPLSHPDILAAVSYAPKIFTFSYDDIPDAERPRKPGISRQVIHAQPGIFADLEVVKDTSVDAGLEAMLTLAGRNRTTGY